jgi:hypothetical protein
VRVHKWGFRVETRYELPLLDGSNMLLTLDNYELMRPNCMCKSLDIGVCDHFSGSQHMSLDWNSPQMFSRSMPSITAPKLCFSLAVLVMGVTTKVGSGARTPGAMLKIF